MGPDETPLLIDCGADVITSFWVTAVVVMVKVWTALVFTPPLAVPPLSWSWTDTVAVPENDGFGVYVRVPAALTAGCTVNNTLLSLVTVKVSV